MDLVSILVWVLFGAVAGWVASLIMGNRQSWLTNIIVGIVGAFLGGFLVGLLGGPGGAPTPGLDLRSFAVAVFGAVVLLALVNWLRRR